ncbi:DNA cytosine methyltransferase [Acinetobacter baumannii]|uniref:DNA cytosine methyltransferase n=1 Tax=Acinetobacter baumannii TaxID=470 RepID=UPI002417F0CC|nr:DNA cytosine methyltransferase [Acinetobacter baumannii]WFQ22487.1 DNA cytosine methyltransferase [Acinetobacter baumannii]WFQ26104.1 DNA cytosine methyltransferase [Acinetobacter baumannii]WFQ29755.1 DNA cytosine methyltransferase [Acinetobacter baumannii]
MNLALFPNELIIDNFAGGGGTSTGLEAAFGRAVDIAINHDPKALAMHRANHPDTKHYCESVWDVDPIEATQNQPVGLVWLSPDCKHFSKAKGGKPVEKKIRGLAWIALRWADLTRPRVIMLENVEEFKTWGRLAEDGKPCPKHKGETFRSFVKALRYQGYDVEWRELKACDYGSPTTRKRFFLIARRDGLPIVWPKQTHGDPESKAVLSGKLKPWRTAAECIDWSLPCPSIFTRQKSLADATLRRIATGTMRYVINNPRPFIVKSNHGGDAFRGQKIESPLQAMTSKNGYAVVMPFLAGAGGPKYSAKPTSIKKPIGTLVASGNYKGIVAPVLTECANASTPRCMPANEPLRTICAGVKGGHHALVSAFLAKNYTGVIGSDADKPIHTITSKDHHSIVASHLVKLRNNNIGHRVDEPIHTITSSGAHFAEVRAFLTAFYGNERDGNSIDNPLRTIPTRDRFGLVTVEGQTYQIADIGFRMLQPHELFKAQGFPDDYIFSYGIDEHGNTVKLTKTEQTRMVGNSVCPQLSEALVRANFSHEKKYQGAA